ncbi:hypothetical protein ACQP2X_45665 [Actinoplanes sp. CA-131856]
MATGEAATPSAEKAEAAQASLAEQKARRQVPSDDQNATKLVADLGGSDKTAVAGMIPPRRKSSDIPAVPGVNRSNRPAWTPMPVTPSYSSSPGVTVFGTRLTYRQAAIGFGVVLLIVVLVVVLVVQAFGDDNDGNTDANAVTPTTSAGAAPPGSAPASGAAKPTTKAPTTPAANALPAGWTLFTDPTGFKIPRPANASRKVTSNGTEFKWNNRLLIVSQTTSPEPDAYEDWVEQEKDRANTIYKYDKVRIDRVTGYFKNAADWEYYYTTSTNNRQRVVKRNIVVNDHQAYSLNWYVSPEDWDASQADLKAIYAGFKSKA